MNSLQTNDDLAQALIKAETEEELQKVTALFNLNLKKKAIIRASKLSELQDSITSEMSNRVDTRSAEFSNKDLLDYMKVIQDIIGKSDMNPEMPSTLLLMQVAVSKRGCPGCRRRTLMTIITQLLRSIKKCILT